MNDEILKVIQIMKRSNYFISWNDLLLDDSLVHEWKYILTHSDDSKAYTGLASVLHDHSVPFVIVNEYIDEFFRYFQHYEHAHRMKNKIAEAYLNKKLSHDKKLIEKELNKNVSVLLESKKELINAHMKWMKCFINTVISAPEYFELDYTKCYVGKWLLKENNNVKGALFEQHMNLHSMARSALRMYKQKDYAYFLLLYNDILTVSYQIRDTISHIYMTKSLTSLLKDPLSGQANYFQLDHDIQKNSDENSILIFNIQEFKKINLLYGHRTCDQIIKEIGTLIEALEDTVQTYRIYGDEFAVIFKTKDQSKFITSFNNKFKEHNFHAGDKTIFLSFYGSYSKISDHVLEYCEYGLMLSKKSYGEFIDINNINRDQFLEYANQVTFSQKLKLAFLDNRILTYYQPIMDLKSGKVTKYEVLMRVKDINGEILTPITFLDILKKMYMYPEVTKRIIQNSFQFFKDNTYEFSVNISYADIMNENTKAFILKVLKENIEIAKRCTFEILEHEAILNESGVISFFEEIHSHGVRIALDDFGVGYSNYDTIFKYDIDYIKIDGSLVQSILTSEKSKTFVESISEIAKKMGAKVILEYVSSEEIYNTIVKMDVDYAQGYYIGKPSAEL